MYWYQQVTYIYKNTCHHIGCVCVLAQTRQAHVFKIASHLLVKFVRASKNRHKQNNNKRAYYISNFQLLRVRVLYITNICARLYQLYMGPKHLYFCPRLLRNELLCLSIVYRVFPSFAVFLMEQTI